MQGFMRRTDPAALRRLVTMVPALIVLALGLDPTRALVISQVVLSFGIPFALIPLVMLTSRRDVMGTSVNRRATTVVAWGIAGVIIALNAFLLVQTFSGLRSARRWLAETFQQIVDSLPDDWTDLELDVRLPTSRSTSTPPSTWSRATRSRTRDTTGTGASSSRIASATRPPCRPCTAR